MTRRGATLLEVVTALAVLSAVVGLSLSAVAKARESAARVACQNYLRQQGVAVLGYESAKGRLPPGGLAGPFDPLGVPDGVAHGLWPVVGPHLGETGKYRLTISWDHPDNRPTILGRRSVLECPSVAGDRLVDGVGVAVGGPVTVGPFLIDLGLVPPGTPTDGALPVNGRVRLTEITDGASHTLLVVAACGRGGVAWPDPATAVPVKGVLAAGPHPAGTGVCFADGSVRFLPADTPLELVAALATRAGGEVME